MSTRDGTLTVGVDVGGTAIKVAPVAPSTGSIGGEVVRIPTPRPATPEASSGDPARARDSRSGDRCCRLRRTGRRAGGVTRSAANIDGPWIGCDAAAMLTSVLGRTTTVINDAAAAGIAEVHHGAGRDRGGVVLVVTLGTGIGAALFTDGRLVPNTELGHIELDGRDAELLASERARVDEALSWPEFAARVDRYLDAIEALLNPQLVILGGGVSSQAAEFLPLLRRNCDVVAAPHQNDAGIVGAAMAAVAL